MTANDFQVGEFLFLGSYEGMVVETGSDFIVVQFKNWTGINPWTGEYPRITFKYFSMLDKAKNESL